jgi:hypothetical protein
MDDSGNAMALDSAGNIHLTGVFVYTADFGGGALTAGMGGMDCFVAKFRSDGVHLWSKNFWATSGNEGKGIGVDMQDNVIVGVDFAGAIDFGCGRLDSPGGYSMALVKLSSSGECLWSRRLGSGRIFGFGMDGANNILLTGYFYLTLDLGGGTLTAPTYDGMFAAKFDPSGNHVWSRATGGLGYYWSQSLAVDGQGSVLITGYFQYTANFGGMDLRSDGDASDAFVVKYTAGGEHAWSSKLGGTGFDGGSGMAVDRNDNPLCTGYFTGTATSGGASISSAGNYEAFLMKLTP